MSCCHVMYCLVDLIQITYLDNQIEHSHHQNPQATARANPCSVQDICGATNINNTFTLSNTMHMHNKHVYHVFLTLGISGSGDKDYGKENTSVITTALTYKSSGLFRDIIA